MSTPFAVLLRHKITSFRPSVHGLAMSSRIDPSIRSSARYRSAGLTLLKGTVQNDHE